MSEHRTDPLIGSVLDGRYDVRARLARGGMSTVYRAVDLRLDREVALKVLYPHLAEDPALVARFELEAKTAARLSHPHVVNVLDQGVDRADGSDSEIAYLAMEYVPGYTLRTVLQRQGALTPRIALAYLDAIVDGLAAAHAAGLVHRDMKPENVLVSRDGRIKVADFGLARAATHHTGTGATLVGTVAYISPELVKGSPADERSDIYAVGIMLYEMLTGRQPFTGASPIQVAYQHINDQVPAPSEVAPGLAEDLDELVLWCTAPEPQDRPADAGALLTELRQIRMALADEDLDFEGAVLATAPASPEIPDDGPAGEATTVALGASPVHPRDDDDLDEVDDPDRTEAFGPDQTEVIGVHSTVALDPETTTTIPRPAAEPNGRTVPLPARPEHSPRSAPIEATGGGTQDSAPAGPLLPVATGRADRVPTPRQQRRQAARAARTPTEDLGRTPPRRWWIWGAVLLILAALLSLLGWYFGSGPGGIVTVPDVAGHSRASAVQQLEELGVGYTLTAVHHDLVAEDSVVETDPVAGTEVRRLTTVVVTLSQGPQLFAVPDVSGMTQQQADQRLRSAGVQLGAVARAHSDSVDEGLVLDQDPTPGAELRRDHRVSVVVSDGPEPVTVPDLTGLTVDQATQALEQLGLDLEVAGSEHSTEVQAGRISSQDPAEGQLRPGETVQVTESLGPRLVEVPDLTDLDLEQARQLLEDAGFQVEETTILGDVFGDGSRVRSQNPDAGTEAEEGSTVHLLVF
ncbi:PASTA domain-containing protein [Micrococcus terreus]|uniref:PASTA domain-containing protein n=1 Tax=Micrococcus terreus TaxID=574650 RepID=UPI003D71C43B